jgi:hypothetical protein
MNYTIPLVAVPSQTLTVQLGAQSCRINVRQRRTGLFVDLYVRDAPVFEGVKALDRCKLVRDAYLDFTGELFFADTQGTSDPDYTGLGGRFLFIWSDGAA